MNAGLKKIPSQTTHVETDPFRCREPAFRDMERPALGDVEAYVETAAFGDVDTAPRLSRDGKAEQSSAAVFGGCPAGTLPAARERTLET